MDRHTPRVMNDQPGRDLGRFRAGALPAGPLSLRLRPVAAGPQAGVVTGWITI
jgi:hypothetical protein